MFIRSLAPWVRATVEPAPRRETDHPFIAMQRSMDRACDNIWQSFDLTPFGSPSPTGERGIFAPNVEVRENDTHVTVTAELAGLSAKDIDLSLANGVLRIRGEKKGERSEDDKGLRYSERTFGSFERQITLPCEVDADKVDAAFKDGLLTISLLKVQPAAAKARTIEVRAD
jgi:HSP20 family protein